MTSAHVFRLLISTVSLFFGVRSLRLLSSVLPENCGMSDPSRIIGGVDAPPSKWPWMVSVTIDDSSHFCGGFLVTDTHVLTAAHCVNMFSFMPGELRVTVGTNDLDTDVPQEIVVKQVFVHPKYANKTDNDSDIAILKLNNSVAFDMTISPACLPTSEPEVGQKVFAVGWGKTFVQSESFDPILQEVAISVLDPEYCQVFDNMVNETMICAGVLEGGKDSCSGDSGGPLLTEGKDGRWQAVGVISFGHQCAVPGYPGVYTNVYKFVPWLLSVLQES